MKKFLSIVILLALMIPFLSSCKNSVVENENLTSPTESSEMTTTSDITSDNDENSSQTTEETTPESTTPPKTMSIRIGSFNIANGRNVNHDMKILADDILQANLDIVGIQEVDKLAKRSKYIDTMKVLAEYTGYQYYYYTKAINITGDEATYGQKGEYGTGILSKYPIISTNSFKLESGTKEQRMLGYAKIDVNGYEINFYNTHLSHDSTELRLGQLETLEKTLKDKKYCILTGDFNISGFSEFLMLPSLNKTCNDSNPLPTFSSSSKSIDNILFSNEFTLISSNVHKNDHSDHYMLYADFTFIID